jgi:hypothetical protein
MRWVAPSAAALPMPSHKMHGDECSALGQLRGSVRVTQSHGPLVVDLIDGCCLARKVARSEWLAVPPGVQSAQ